LEKLMAAPKPGGHWIQYFLAEASRKYPERTAAFFMRRVERAAADEDWEYRPCNHGPYGSHYASENPASGMDEVS